MSRHLLSKSHDSAWPPPPPAHESDSEKQIRLEDERKARIVSESIDRSIELEKSEKQKHRAQIKILVLGQSESGKSTILKNFHLYFHPQAFQSDLSAWRAVIRFNLIRSVNCILDLLDNKGSRPSSTDSASKAISDHLRRLALRLAPLRHVENLLLRRHSASGPVSGDEGNSFPTRGGASIDSPLYTGWKALSKFKRSSESNVFGVDDVDDSQRVIEACKDDIVSLWANESIQATLKTRSIALEEQSGFFLPDAGRVAAHDYMPTTNDILRARLPTSGVEEHRIVINEGSGHGKDWLFYDVGGAGGQRAVWAPFVDDVKVVIFLAPICAFDQPLDDDPRTNRLTAVFDSWKSVCGNQLLSEVHFILLLNKCDILDKKLKSGVPFAKYVSSYRDANDTRSVTKYLDRKFEHIHKTISPSPRKLYTHITCAINAKTTATVIKRIQEGALLHNLLTAGYL
ncbi:hypothetical protein SERLA73DRAFT_101731 [Serpula lacrymans var. lacrymans S7.3]|uniref:G-alpha-domain-containing protein n=2 Tax=Serpula lacrymans var. lacrymans TaxID=341189 RepID=F8PK74_SERL3|nr:uncharacterized protein SERLADRAFT_359432 [Serpula lacrymans var. lacrymans S7.9]EGO03528.1 hypothetical protein SERLA73DRAFT_101731 [Serpula lacrymans var. lacrymans S7.3]EGO29340.1 hypothetical protein SERLADRAFT_359432 [Serpula lacrymans var. lacrymans S7.9]